MAIFTDDISINTLIGVGASFTGNLRISGFIRVDGDIDGNIETSGRIIVGEKARIRGNISATAAVIGGIVEGDIVAPDGVKILSSSVIIGDVMTRHLEVGEGSLIQGQYVALSDENEYNEAVLHWQDVKAIRAKSLFADQGTF